MHVSPSFPPYPRFLHGCRSVQFVSALGWTVMSGATSHWFFFRNDPQVRAAASLPACVCLRGRSARWPAEGWRGICGSTHSKSNNLRLESRRVTHLRLERGIAVLYMQKL
eukprot:4457711-Pleurochrysis_carterae.AAC.2